VSIPYRLQATLLLLAAALLAGPHPGTTSPGDILVTGALLVIAALYRSMGARTA
jgi:hypothetical protein